MNSLFLCTLIPRFLKGTKSRGPNGWQLIQLQAIDLYPSTPIVIPPKMGRSIVIPVQTLVQIQMASLHRFDLCTNCVRIIFFLSFSFFSKFLLWPTARTVNTTLALTNYL